MKTVSVLAGVLFLIAAAVTQCYAFETMRTGKGPPEYRFNSSEFIYFRGDTNNIDITSMLERQGINPWDLKLEWLKLVIDGRVSATFQTYAKNEIRSLTSLNVTPGNRILFMPDIEATKNRRWHLLLANPDRLNIKGMHLKLTSWPVGQEKPQPRQGVIKGFPPGAITPPFPVPRTEPY